MARKQIRIESLKDQIILYKVGSNIKKTRLEKEINQSSLAILCNFNKAHLSRIEAGQINLRLLTLSKISAALQVNLVELISSLSDIKIVKPKKSSPK